MNKLLSSIATGVCSITSIVVGVAVVYVVCNDVLDIPVKQYVEKAKKKFSPAE